MAEEKTEEKKDKFSIPLQKISFKADIKGMFAQVSCTQEYRNENPKPVEAVYVFPMPEESSVAGCKMVIGTKTIKAELKEQEQARKEYNEAVAAGHYAAFLEQKRTNVFRMNVGGIEPGETIKVVTVYNQRVPWQNNGGRFNIPLVVAPRFIPGQPTGAKKGGGWAEDTDVVPDASEITPVVAKDGVPYTADIAVDMSPGFACKITSPSHGLIVGEHRSRGKAVKIEAKDLTPDRDFIICYQTQLDKVGVGVHRGSFDGEQFAVISIIPPGQTVDKEKDIILCLDESGSMTGAKIEGLKLIAEKIIKKLLRQNPRNRVGAVAFANEERFNRIACYELLHPLSEITDSTFTAINKIKASGGTMAGAALDYCFGLFPDEANREKYILLVGDGQTEDRWKKIVPGIRVIAVGIDAAVNMAYLRDIARETGGVSIGVYPGEDYDSVAGTLAGLLSGPVLQNIRVMANNAVLSDVLGATDVYQSMPAVLYLKANNLPDEVEVTGTDKQGKKIAIPFELKDVDECLFCHQLWAREKLREQNLSEDEMVAISLKYGVLCGKTAFVAVLLKPVPGGKPERVEIPVSLPYTWDYDSVFGKGGPPQSLMLMRSSGVFRDAPNQFAAGPGSIMDATAKAMMKKLQKIPTIATLSAGSRPSDELEDLVTSFENGSLSRPEAEKRWKTLSFQIATTLNNWTVSQQAKTYYFLLKLRTYGFSVPKTLLQALSAEPPKSETDAYDWWKKAQKELGKSVK